MTERLRVPILILIVTAIAFVIVAIEFNKPKIEVTDADIEVEMDDVDVIGKAARYPLAKEIVAPHGFINATDELKIKDLIGKKVILVDFWTYSCINCQRTLPYLTDWYDKYKDQGLEIIGIHSPEFEFEKETENVQAAVDKWDIKYPVVQDNDFGTWRAYKNRFWPRKYLIDIDGFIVYDHIGEGGYDETEAKIQELLKERMEKLELEGEVTTTISDVEAETAGEVKSPEIYFGYSRNEALANGNQQVAGPQSFERPDNIKKNQLYLTGEWDITEEFAQNTSAGASVIFKYESQRVFIVAGADKPVKMRVLQDGKPLDGVLGRSVTLDNGDTAVIIDDEALYRLIEDSETAEHTIEMILEEPGAQIFTFTFG